MAKYFGTYKNSNTVRPFTWSFEANSLPIAIDKFLTYCGVRTASDDDEYEIFHIVGNDRYVPVAQKFKTQPRTSTQSTLTLDEKKIDESVFTEKVYVSWRDAA